MGEIFTPQARHLPRSQSQPKTGTLSYHLIGVAHFGHLEAGATMETSSGMRRMQTFRKLPITMPKRKTKMMIGKSATRSQEAAWQRITHGRFWFQFATWPQATQRGWVEAVPQR